MNPIPGVLTTRCMEFVEESSVRYFDTQIPVQSIVAWTKSDHGLTADCVGRSSKNLPSGARATWVHLISGRYILVCVSYDEFAGIVAALRGGMDDGSK